jgi:hypothetical protein
MKILQRFAFMQILLALFVSSAALSAFGDPPSRAVRLQYISGPVSIQPGGVNDWVAAVVNRPLTTADRVWTDKAAKAELHLGSAALRLNAETSMTLTNVSDDIVQIELDQGTLNLHIRHLFGGETYEIDTPNQAFTILKSGDYRFDVDPNADTTSITVWRGEGEANGQGPGVKLKSGHQASFSGGTSMQHQMASAPDFDGFDDWCRVRDDREDHAKSYQYVSADVVGADELDEYGTWRTVGAYGPVWVPAVAPGWAPYHYGHWVWVEPWGWTWVDDAPWGYAPCHYGRWVNTGGFWAWAPGPIVVARPVYAPALVAWVGGPHFGVGLSFGGGGGVGWFALGWGEPYVPSYAVSRTYFQQVNVSNTHITNITNVTNNYYVTNNNTTVVNNNIQNIHYANQTVNGAVTAVPTSAMTSSQPVAKAAVAVPASAIKPAAFTTAAPVAPAKTAVLGANAGVHAAVPPTQAMARPVVSHTAPPPKPVPFEAKQEALAKNPGRPLDTQTEAQLRANVASQAPASVNHGASTPANTQPAKPGSPSTATAAQPAKPGSPATPANAQVPKPGSPATPAAGQTPKPGTPASTMDSKTTAGGAQPQPSTPARNVPRPPQATVHPVSTNPASPATPATPASPAAASRPVPRPPTSGTSNGASNSPNVTSSPKPTPQSSNTDVKPSNPRPPQNASRPNVEQSNPRPPQNASRPKVEQSNPRPPQNTSWPNVAQSSPRPPVQSQPAPRQSNPRPPAQSQPHQNNQQHHTESKPEHKNEGR